MSISGHSSALTSIALARFVSRRVTPATLDRRGTCSRLTQLIEGNAQRSAGDFDQPTIRLIHFEHHKDRAGKCKRGNEQCCYHAGIARCEEPETGEDNC